jgi:hypothetical protein
MSLKVLIILMKSKLETKSSQFINTIEGSYSDNEPFDQQRRIVHVPKRARCSEKPCYQERCDAAAGGGYTQIDRHIPITKPLILGKSTAISKSG